MSAPPGGRWQRRFPGGGVPPGQPARLRVRPPLRRLGVVVEPAAPGAGRDAVLPEPDRGGQPRPPGGRHWRGRRQRLLYVPAGRLRRRRGELVPPHHRPPAHQSPSPRDHLLRFPTPSTRPPHPPPPTPLPPPRPPPPL